MIKRLYVFGSLLVFSLGMLAGMVIALGLLDRMVSSCPYLDEVVLRI